MLGEIVLDPAVAATISPTAIDPAEFDSAWHHLEERVVRDLILSGTRPDGRSTKCAAVD